MKRLVILLFSLLLSFVLSWGGNRKTLLVIIDGIPYDCITRLLPPAIMDIAHEGGLCRAMADGIVGTCSQTPTISAIGYMNILTGTWMNKHQVKGNENIHPNYNYPTLFWLAKHQKQPYSTAVYSSWTDNRTILIGEGLEATGHLKVDFHADGYDLDTVTFPKQPGDLQLQAIDGRVCEEAARTIANEAPDVNWVYLWYTDDAFHINGNGMTSDNAVLQADAQLAKVWAAVKDRQRKTGEEWLVIVTTDHGRDFLGFNHGGQSFRERSSWIATNAKSLNGHFSDGRLAQVDILPTISRFMHFDIPADISFEWDGQPFTGNVDLENFHALSYDHYVDLFWDCVGNKRNKTKIYYSPTNKRFSGGTDNWMLMGETEAGSDHYRVDISNYMDSKAGKFAAVSPNGIVSICFPK